MPTRRAFARYLLTAAAAVPIPPLRLWAQNSLFPGDQRAALRQMAAAVLPQSLGPKRLDQITDGFIRWVHGYRAGADMEHGYGFTSTRKTAGSPASTYMRQLSSLAGVPAAALRERLTAEFTEAKINNLPQTPDGRHVGADLMAFWFRSAEANDVCYDAAIGRDDCLGFATAGERPKPLAQRGSRA